MIFWCLAEAGWQLHHLLRELRIEFSHGWRLKEPWALEQIRREPLVRDFLDDLVYEIRLQKEFYR